ncbi:MAG: HD domain-containing phosphohydrolase [Phycisphaerales bacterium]
MNPMLLDNPIDPPLSDLRERYRSLGLDLVLMNGLGAIDQKSIPDDGLLGVMLKSEEFRLLLNGVALNAANHDRAVELTPGLFVIVTPRLRRRRIVGFAVGVLGSHSLKTEADALARLRDWSVNPDHLSEWLVDRPSTDTLAAHAFALRWSLDDLSRLAETGQEIRSFGNQLSDAYEELSLLHKIGENMNVVIQPERFIELVCRELLEVLSFRWIGVKLIEDAASAQLSGMFTIQGDTPDGSQKVDELSERLLHERPPLSPIVINGGRRATTQPWATISPSLLVHPIMRSNKVVGVVLAAEKDAEAGDISSVDIKLIATMTSQLQIFLDNVGLYEDVQLMFLGTLEALSSAIDAKDRYTCGHSERVALLSRDLAHAIGLGDEVVERVHISGLVHDVGKIGVPEAVLCKPGRLTDAEFDLVKKHPEIGARILKDIPHFDDIIPGVMFHHEKYDGRGYPHGLAGEDIPLFGRIIAIADSFDAMSSTRTYRAARPRTEVIEEIARCAGSHFDPDFAKLFIELDFSEYDRMSDQHSNDYRADRSEAA